MALRGCLRHLISKLKQSPDRTVVRLASAAHPGRRIRRKTSKQVLASQTRRSQVKKQLLMLVPAIFHTNLHDTFRVWFTESCYEGLRAFLLEQAQKRDDDGDDGNYGGDGDDGGDGGGGDGGDGGDRGKGNSSRGNRNGIGSKPMHQKKTFRIGVLPRK